jgi:hypothetical protein
MIASVSLEPDYQAHTNIVPDYACQRIAVEKQAAVQGHSSSM